MNNKYIYFNFFKKKYLTNKFNIKNIWIFEVLKNLNKKLILKALNFIFPDKKFKINTLNVKKNNKIKKKVYIFFKNKNYLIQ